jgi:F-type H+-transporting ATPase subunit b
MTEFQVAEAVTAPATGQGTVAPAEKAPFPPFDPTHFASQLFWLAITFIAFYFVIAKVATPRIAAILRDRRGRIDGDLGEAEKARQEAEAAGIAYEKALAEARARAYDIAEEANEKARTASAEERAATEADLAGKLAAAEARIAEIKNRALSEVGAIAGDAAEAVVRAVAQADASRPEIEAAVAAAMRERSA